MPAPDITPLPDPPLRSDSPSTFSSKAEAFVAALVDFVTEANALGDYMEGVEAGAVDWGDIAGSIASQADLQAALDAKADAAAFVVLPDQAAYDALDPPDPDTFYFIPEA